MPKSLCFPKDELPHPSVIEWWYFNGNFRDDAGKQYSFMYCLFKADPKKVKLPFFDKIPSKNFYFSHSLLSSLNNKKIKSGIHFFYEGLDRESFSRDLLFVKGKNGLLMEENSLFDYHLKNEDFDLCLLSKKKPLLVNGGWIDLKTKDTYYYSLTNLETKGVVVIDGKKNSVSGKSWMDHQWADTAYSAEDKWKWFSIQLNNNSEILCFEYGDKQKTKLASISYADGRQENINEVNLKPLDKKWRSPKTQAVYTLGWQIEIPKKNIKLTVAPKIIEQEVIFGSINYWEGGIDVSGKFGDESVSGEGFLELVGAPMGKSVARIYLDETKKLVSDYLANYITRP